MAERETSKIKWCFLATNTPSLMEFLGKLAYQVVKEGNECILATDSKIAEYSKRQYFPKDVKTLSKVDWCASNYKKDRGELENLSWKEFFPDFDRLRLFNFGYNNSVGMVSQLYQFIDFVLKKEKPDVVIHEPPAGTFSEIFYHLCQKNNITYLGLINSRIEDRIDIYDLEHTCSKYEKAFKKINNISEEEKKFTKDFVISFLTHKRLPSYMKYQNLYQNDIVYLKNYLKSSIRMWPFWWKYILKRSHFKPFDLRSRVQLKNRLWYPWKALRLRIRNLFRGNIYNCSDNSDNFFLFPLHIQPEASTLVLATYFCDQVNTVKNIAFSLPFPYKLYIKEHPAVKGDRPKNFYKELKQIPNVVLISPFENVENLIKKSQGIITLTSTVGIEAALAGKPAYVLGNVFYSHHPLCKKVNSFEELKQKIEMDLINKPVTSGLENINLRFITSYLRNTIPGCISSASNKNDTNNYKVIVKGIKRIFLEGKPC